MSRSTFLSFTAGVAIGVVGSIMGWLITDLMVFSPPYGPAYDEGYRYGAVDRAGCDRAISRHVPDAYTDFVNVDAWRDGCYQRVQDR